MPFYEKCENCRDSIIQTYGQRTVDVSTLVYALEEMG